MRRAGDGLQRVRVAPHQDWTAVLVARGKSALDFFVGNADRYSQVARIVFTHLVGRVDVRYSPRTSFAFAHRHSHVFLGPREQPPAVGHVRHRGVVEKRKGAGHFDGADLEDGGNKAAQRCFAVRSQKIEAEDAAFFGRNLHQLCVFGFLGGLNGQDGDLDAVLDHRAQVGRRHSALVFRAGA